MTADKLLFTPGLLTTSATVKAAMLRDAASRDRLRCKKRVISSKLLRIWRRGPGSNRRIKVLQTSPLPLGYRALAGQP
jgi:hypothetical protein